MCVFIFSINIPILYLRVQQPTRFVHTPFQARLVGQHIYFLSMQRRCSARYFRSNRHSDKGAYCQLAQAAGDSKNKMRKREQRFASNDIEDTAKAISEPVKGLHTSTAQYQTYFTAVIRAIIPVRISEPSVLPIRTPESNDTKSLTVV